MSATSYLENYRMSAAEQARTADLLSLLPKGRRSVLDVGARDGHFSMLLTRYFEEVTALDLEKPSFDYPRVTTVKGNATALGFPDNSFDCTFCTEVLEHIPEIEKACREIMRVARHEVIIGVPFEQDTRLARTTCRTCGKVCPPWGHVNSFSRARLFQLFPGMKLVSESYAGSTRECTNAVSAALMDFARHPWGTYQQEEPCIHCGAKLLPVENRTFLERVASQLALGLDKIQVAFTRPHGKWIHLVLAK